MIKNKISILLLIILASGCYNVTTNKTGAKNTNEVIMNDTTPKVTGIGQIFFKSQNPKETKEWYGKNLGLAINEYGSPFEFRNANRPEEINYLMWSPF